MGKTPTKPSFVLCGVHRLVCALKSGDTPRRGKKRQKTAAVQDAIAFAGAGQNCASFWTAPALWRFEEQGTIRQTGHGFYSTPIMRWKSGRRLPQSRTLSRLPGPNKIAPAFGLRQPSGAFPSELPCPSPFRRWLEIICDQQPVNFKAINGLYRGRRSGLFEPACRAPRILVRHRYQPVFHGVLVNIIQAGKIGFLIGEPALAKIEPDLPARRAVKFVNPPGGLDVENAQHVRKAGCVGRVRRRMGNEMIMI